MANVPPSNVESDDKTDLVILGKRVVTPEGERAAAIVVREGKIVDVREVDDVPSGVELFDAGDLVVMPGLVDTHVHINEPGRTEWEGFETATRAAAAGGVTTLIEMPLNSIPSTTTVKALREKVEVTKRKLRVDVGFWGGVVPGNAEELRGLWEAGCFGFKCFLVDSGVAEFGRVTEKDLHAALPELAKIGAPLLVHAELPGPIEEALRKLPQTAPAQKYATWLESRPRAAENEAIELVLRLGGEYGTRAHIVHLSSADAIFLLRRAKSERVQVSVETCPHYLTFAAEEIVDGSTEFKCAPPIRERENRDKLWAALGDGTIDFVATDHSPCPPKMKLCEEGDFLRAWGGIASLQLSLPVTWTEARSRGYSLTHIAKWMCTAPAKLAGLEKQKGSIAVGCDADFVVWDPKASFRVDAERLEHRHKLTPYAGRELSGVVAATFLRGKKIFEPRTFYRMAEGRVLVRGRE
jgi:allantoinase